MTETKEDKVILGEDPCQGLFSIFLRVLLATMSVVLAYVGLHQDNRHDAVVWMPIFFVPASLTLISAINVRYIATLWFKSTVSVYLGSSFVFLIWLFCQTIITMVETFQEGMGSYNPVEYQVGRDALAVAVCIGWQKFHLMITKEHLKEMVVSSSHSLRIPPMLMLKRVLLTMLIPGALAAFCYIESVRPAIKSSSEALKTLVMHSVRGKSL